MTSRVLKSNPSFLSDDDLKENFVVRHADLDLIVGIIRENTTGSNQHILVIGPRGSGKTTLVLRAALEVRADGELNDRWYPLVFSEESYQVVSAGEFWLEALFHLAEQTGDERWKNTWSELRDETDDNRLGERALYQLLDFADSQGKRILLIVENLNMLLGDLINDGEAWKIRHTLMNEPRLMLLASATSRLEHFENSSQAMFEMFKMHQLVPLDDGECNAIWELISGQKLEGEKIRPIRILTGGNPRLLAIIAKFGAGRSFGRLLDDLVDLIDDHTEYFKSHLDNLPAIERKAYLALAELWDLSTAREIAKAARLDVNTASSLLNRLAGRGAVTVEKKGKRTKYYAVAERMYNIYYLMRRRGRPADRVKAAVKFMIGMYGPESATKLIAEEACKLAAEHCGDHYMAYAEDIKEVRDAELLKKIIFSTPKHFLEFPIPGHVAGPVFDAFRTLEKEADEVHKAVELVGGALTQLEGGQYEQAMAGLDAVVGEFSDRKGFYTARLLALALLVKGVSLKRLGRCDDAIQVFDDILGRFRDDNEAGVEVEVASALIFKGNTLVRLGRPEDAIGSYSEVVEGFADSKEPGMAEQVALAHLDSARILRKIGKYDQAEESLRGAIEFDPESSDARLELIGLLLEMPERQVEAVRLAEETIGRKPDDAALLNRVSWQFYKQNISSLFQKGETWARRAVSISPDNSSYNHTLACILAALGEGKEALEAAGKYIADVELVQKSIEDAITLFVDLASSGHAKEALELLEHSPAAAHLEPLVVGLKLYNGEDVKSAVEILEVARDVVGRIEARERERESRPQI